jgi:hypothetical protein
MRFRLIVFGAAVLLAAAPAAAQRRVAAQEPATVAMTIALKAGEKVYNFNGRGQCVYAPVASIFGLRAERWTAARTGDAPGASLVVWRPASGGDLVSIAFTIGDTRYAMSTVKVGDKGTTEGTGGIAFARDGAGGTFTVNGTAGNGARISGTVTCAAFTAATAEGGD